MSIESLITSLVGRKTSRRARGVKLDADASRHEVLDDDAVVVEVNGSLYRSQYIKEIEWCE